MCLDKQTRSLLYILFIIIIINVLFSMQVFGGALVFGAVFFKIVVLLLLLLYLLKLKLAKAHNQPRGRRPDVVRTNILEQRLFCVSPHVQEEDCAFTC